MNTPFSIQVKLPDEDSTIAYGTRFSKIIVPGMRVYLSGELGAGKSAFVRAILRALGVSGPIRSPTYNLIEVYAISGLNFYHFDFYRFEDENEWEDAGFRDLFSEKHICFVEWPEKAGGQLPDPDISVRLIVEDEGRLMTLRAHSSIAQRQLQQLYGDIE